MPRSGRVVSRWVDRRALELWTGEGVVATVRAARTTGREVEPEAVVATVAARSAGHYFIHALYYFTLD